LTRTGQQRKCLEDAVDALCIAYTTNNTKQDYPLTTYADVLSLYLNRDFSKILHRPLEELYSSYNFASLDDYQIADKVAEITSRCTNKMAQEILKYPLIDTDIMINIFNTKINIIKNTVESSIKNFLNLTKQEKEDLLTAQKERDVRIEKQIQFLCGNEAYGKSN